MSPTILTSLATRAPMGLKTLESPHPEPSLVVTSPPSKDNNVGEEAELLSVSWSPDSQCFATGTSNGFRLYSYDPFAETVRRNLRGGGFGIVEILSATNTLALVGGGEDPQYPPYKVMLWADHLSRFSNELTFRSTILSVRLRQGHLMVVLEHRVYVYSMPDHRLLQQIETFSNPRGLCCVPDQLGTSVLACPGLCQGQVRVVHYPMKAAKLIAAHDSGIACLAFTSDGRLLATSSIKGTLIRIFNVMDGTKLQEVRRGAEKAEIYSIAFSPSTQWMVVSSDRGTIHTFHVKIPVGEDGQSSISGEGTGIVCQNSSPGSLASLITDANFSSSLSLIKGMLPRYFSSEWSFAQFYLPKVTRCIAKFGAQHSVIIVGLDGSFRKCKFDPVNGGTMVEEEFVQFLKLESNPPQPTST